jgi:hypothetical protein
MSEMKHRKEAEQQFYARVARTMSRHRNQLAFYLGSPPDLANVPEEFWRQVQDDLEADVLLAVLLIIAVSAQQHGMERTLSRSFAQQAGQRQAAKVATDFAAHSREMTARATSPASLAAGATGPAGAAGATPPTVTTAADIADTVFSRARAESIAITETTVARQTGANQAVRGKESIDDTWRTEADAKVCPICQPLHLTNRNVWAAKFPDGPPAHPRCRCEIVYAIEDTITQGAT